MGGVPRLPPLQPAPQQAGLHLPRGRGEHLHRVHPRLPGNTGRVGPGKPRKSFSDAPAHLRGDVLRYGLHHPPPVRLGEGGDHPPVARLRRTGSLPPQAEPAGTFPAPDRLFYFPSRHLPRHLLHRAEKRPVGGRLLLLIQGFNIFFMLAILMQRPPRQSRPPGQRPGGENRVRPRAGRIESLRWNRPLHGKTRRSSRIQALPSSLRRLLLPAGPDGPGGLSRNGNTRAQNTLAHNAQAGSSTGTPRKRTPEMNSCLNHSDLNHSENTPGKRGTKMPT